MSWSITQKKMEEAVFPPGSLLPFGMAAQLVVHISSPRVGYLAFPSPSVMLGCQLFFSLPLQELLFPLLSPLL